MGVEKKIKKTEGTDKKPRKRIERRNIKIESEVCGGGDEADRRRVERGRC